MDGTVAVVMPVRNDAPSLRVAVEGVIAQRGVDVHEIVLAVGPSNDDTLEVAQELAAACSVVRLVDNPGGTTPAALNKAIAATTAEIIVRVDARSVLPNDYILHALETLELTGAANVGAIQNPIGATAKQRAIAAAMRSRAGSGGVAYRGATQRRRVDTAYLGVFRREDLVAVGGYDEAFIRNQDAELNARLNAAGREVWLDPRLVVDYYPRATFSALGRQYWQYGWWRQRTARRHRESVKARQLAAPAITVANGVSLVAAPVVGRWGLAFPGAYVGGIIVAASRTEGPITERCLAAVALVVMHTAWGAGFLASFVSSSLLQRH